MKEIIKKLTVCTAAVLCSLNASAYTQVDGFDGPTWYDGRLISGTLQGRGTEANPYKVTSAAELALIAYKVNTGASTFADEYILIDLSDNDIDLGSQVEVDGASQTLNWVPISDSFRGIVRFRGEHFIKGMTIRATGNMWGGPYFFGLFETLNQSVSGARFKDVNFEISRQFEAGSLCGRIDASPTITIENCEATNVRIVQSEGSGFVGGLVGIAAGCTFSHCTVSGILDGHICGGLAGKYNGLNYILDESMVVVEDCHAAVDISVDDYSGVRGGGLIGECFADSKAVIAYCSASGSITAPSDAVRPYLGGLFGYLSAANIEHCASAVSITGKGFVGGLAGFVLSPVSFTECFASGGIELTSGQDTYAGGLMGVLQNSNNTQCNAYVTACTFAGTFKYDKAQLEQMGYGSVAGTCITASEANGIDFFNEGEAFNDVYVDKNMCGLPACSSGTLNGVETKPTRELASQEVEGEHVGYEYCYLMPRDCMSLYKNEHNGQEVAFKDNFILASIPFYVSEGKKSTAFAAYYVTTPFSLSPLESNIPGKGELATFTLPSDLTFVDYEVTDDNTMVYPIDPGEADLTVALSGTNLTRTIHLNIAYGIVWNDDEPSDIFVGDGSKNTPYMIQNVSQFVKAAADNTKNREGAYFQLANDIFMNTHLIQTDETVKDGAREWTPVEWHANLDGNGNSIYGMYVTHFKEATIRKTGSGTNSESFTYYTKVNGAGLFNLLSGNVHDLAIVDSYVNATHFIGLLCGVMTGEASIRSCLTHGIIDGNVNNGGIVGGSREIDFLESRRLSRDANNPVYTSCGTIEDCYACVHVEYGISSGNVRPQVSGSGGGVTGSPVAHILRCVSTGKVENFTSRRGVGILGNGTDSDTEAQTWYFDQQQMKTAVQSAQNRGEHNTSELINGDIFTNEAAWQHEKGRYPMLKKFAKTPYGDLLSMPVHFADGDRAGNVTKIFEFPTENVTWEAVNGDTYVDMINECGAATPMSTTPSNGFEYIYAQTIESKSECTKALRVMALNTSVTGIVGIEFKDPKCEDAWKQVLGKGEDEVVTLRNALTAKGTPQGRQFNQKAKALGVEFFPEMRFFVGITNLSTGILSGLDQLSEVQLPNKLQSIGAEALAGCTSLQTITIPATTGEITPGAFDNCSLQEFDVAPRNEVFNVRCNALFTTGTNDLVAYPPARGESEVTISGAIGEIYPHAFYRIPQLDELYIDNPKPTGTAAWLDPAGESIVHWDADNGGMMDVYINDGTYDGTYDASTGGRYNGVLMKEYLQQDEWNRYKRQGKLHRYFPLEVGKAKWATMYIGFSTQLPSTLKAYRVNKTSDYDLTPQTTEVELKRMKNLLHYTTPVVIQASEAGTYRLMPYEGTVPESNKYENWLQGTSIGQNGEYGWDVYQSDSNEGSVLTLGYNSHGVLGFYYYNNPNNWIPPFKAYIPYNGGMQGASFAVYINDEIDELTDRISANNREQITNNRYYNLNGQTIVNSQLSNSQLPKGVYIRNGKKIVVK